MSFIKEPLPGKPLLQLLKGRRQITYAVRHHAADIQLILAAFRVDIHAACGNYLHAVLRLEPHPGSIAPEHDTGNDSPFVLQVEIAMAGAIPLEIGNLPCHRHIPQGMVTTY